MHRRHLAVTVVVSLLVLACGDGNRPRPNRGPAILPPPNDGTQPLAGALQKGIGTINGAEFKEAIQKIESRGPGAWNGGSTHGECTDAALCGLSFSKVDIDIDPAFDAVTADFKNVGKEGTVLMRLANSDKKNKATGGLSRYVLQPQTTYYVVVSSDDGEKGIWQLVPFDYASGKPDKPVATAWGTFHDCEHKKQRKNAHAGFYSCNGSYDVPDAIEAGAKHSALGDFGIIGALLHFAAYAPSFLKQSPGWVSCAFGCCTLEGS